MIIRKLVFSALSAMALGVAAGIVVATTQLAKEAVAVRAK